MTRRPTPRLRSKRKEAAEWRRALAVQTGAAAASGTAIALAFPPLSLWPLAFVGLAPLISVCLGVSAGRACLVGLVAGSVSQITAMPWVLTSIARLQDISVAAALSPFALFVAWQAAPWALFGVLVASVREAPGPIRVLSIAGAWVVLECLWPAIIPWHLADALGSAAYVRQGADVLGVHGLGLLVMISNGAAAQGILRSVSRRTGNAWSLRSIAVTLVAIPGSLLFYGIVTGPVDPEDGPAQRIALIQAGSSAGQADVAAANDAAWSAYTKRTREVLRLDPQVDLVVWPETVLRAPVAEDPAWRRKVEAFVRESGRPLLFGALGSASPGEHNVVLLFDPFSRSAPQARFAAPPWQAYRKRHLLRFGEYVPVPRWILSQWVTTGAFVPGESAPILHLPNVPVATATQVPLGIAICSEALVPGAYRHAVLEGAQILVNVSDDGWFGGAEPQQHLNAVRLRAVEQGRWLIRVSGAGVSAVIDPRGRVVVALGSSSEASEVVRIPQRVRETLHTRLGDTPWLAVAAVATLLGLTMRSRSAMATYWCRLSARGRHPQGR